MPEFREKGYILIEPSYPFVAEDRSSITHKKWRWIKAPFLYHVT